MTRFNRIYCQMTLHCWLWLLLVALNTALSTLIRVSAAQMILPGRNPEVYLPPRCDGFVLNGLHHGVIFSHDKAETYSPNTNCTVFINIDSNQVVYFHFENFNLQSRVRGKCVDYVQFFSGDLSEKPLTEPMCGQALPKPFSSRSSRIALLFHSNANHETTGFKVRFKKSLYKCHLGDPDCLATDYGSFWSRYGAKVIGLPVVFLLFPAIIVGFVLWSHCS